MCLFIVVWLVGSWMVAVAGCLLVGLPVEWLIGDWLAGCFAVWLLVRSQVRWLFAGWLQVGWLVGWLVGRSVVGWLAGWLASWSLVACCLVLVCCLVTSFSVCSHVSKSLLNSMCFPVPC